MKKRIICMLLSLLLVAAISRLCYVVTDKLSNKFTFIENLVNLVYWAATAIFLVQAGVLLVAHYKRMYPRFLIVFTGTCACVFLLIYSYAAYFMLLTRNARQNGWTELKESGLLSCFIGIHTWFLVPVAAQLFLWILLRRNKSSSGRKPLGKPEIIVF